MDHDSFDFLARRLDAAQTRRLTLGGGGFAALAVLGLATGSAEVLATKKKRRKKRKKKKPEPASCTELCGFDCTFCFFRANAPPLCGNSWDFVGCVQCASDNDCVGSEQAYCVTRIEDREAGIQLEPCDPAVCNCAAGALGTCTQILACNP